MPLTIFFISESTSSSFIGLDMVVKMVWWATL